jgi:hypothetical protein
VFQGHFDVVDFVFTHPQSLVDDASVDSDADCSSDSDSVDNCDEDASDAENDDDESD